MQSPTCPATRSTPTARPRALLPGKEARPSSPPCLRWLLAAFAAVFLAGPPRATAAPGDLDPTFVPAHLLVSSLHAAAIAPSGRVLVGGSLSATNALGEPITSIALLGPDGTLDPSFGVPGIATRVTAITAAEDGTVVCAGLETNGLNAVVRRLTATGALDATLDHVVNGTISPWIYTLARQADGRVLVGGVFQRVDGIPRTNLFRIHVDGTLDESFKTNFTCGGGILALAQQPDGKILLGGYFTNVLGVARRGIARLNLDGSVDTTFNPGSGIQGMVRSIALQADGRVLLGGHFYSFNGVLRAGIARLNSNGTLDTSFNPGAGAELAARDESIEGPAIHAVVIQGDGRIVVGGEFATFDRVTRPNLARLEWNGALDETFDPGAGADGVVHSLNLDATGQLVVVGDFLSVDRQSRVGVARLLNDGTLPVLPTVLTPPADQTVTLGKPATFSVSAKGTPALRYQWLKSGLILAGQTNDTFTLSNCQFADAGSYSVQVANGAGTVTSSAATLIVNPAPVAPVITADPSGAIVVLGGSVSLSAAATGSKPMTWQWRLGSVAVSGATSESLTVSSVSRDDAGSYTARASNAAGTATSAAANVSVIMPPEDQTVRSGSNVTFTVRSFG
ncbi:MAG: immunoglobulin domain-containing protein, partial [Verrucomicrobiales bacterium]|nr:immunoglobulin domain-containing protein [Verrucomicrobiales bacterium]